MTYRGDCASTPSEVSNQDIDLLRSESELKWAAEKAVIDLLGKVGKYGLRADD